MTMTDAHPWSTSLFADLDVEVELDAPLGVHTWYAIGGKADALTFCFSSSLSRTK